MLSKKEEDVDWDKALSGYVGHENPDSSALSHGFCSGSVLPAATERFAESHRVGTGNKVKQMKMKEELENLFGQKLELVEGLNNELYLPINEVTAAKSRKNVV